jgi:hypothetical protein
MPNAKHRIPNAKRGTKHQPHPKNIVPGRRDAKKSETNAADRCVNELYAMMNGYVASCPSQGRLKLEQAPGIARYDHVGIYARDVSCFPVA